MTIAEKIVLPEAGEAASDKGSDKRRALGRGLDSLLPGRPRVVTPIAPAVINRDSPPESAVLAEVHASHTPDGDDVQQIALDKIDSNPYQTRVNFDEEAIYELARSIETNGLLQPIVVRPVAKGRYVLVLGERRCRASKLAGKTTIPAIVRVVSDQNAAEMTVVENLMRQDLNCLEQANAFFRLSQNFGLTQEKIGQRIGASRESVANYIRLLKLPQSVQQYLADGRLGFSEARILLQLANIKQIEQIAQLAVESRLPLSSLQQVVNNANMPGRNLEPEPPKPRLIDPNVRAAQAELEKLLGLRVKITDRNGRGKIIIEYSNLDDFEMVIDTLKRNAD